MAEGFDMSASMHADMLRMCKGDKAKALQMLTGLQGEMEEEKKRSQDRKINELAANFPGISRDALSQILAQNEWDVEKAIIPCFEHQEKEREAQQKKEREEQNKRREEERRVRQAEARAKATDILMQMFSNVPQDKIQALLDENEGDVDLTIDELFKQQTEQEEAQKKRKQEEEERAKQAELERRFTIDTLLQKFGDYCSEAEIEAILVKNNWDVVVASRDFLHLVEERKLDQLKRLYPTLDERDIRDALYKNDWNLIETMKQLRALQAELKAKKEEEERLRVAAEARARELAKQEAERRRLEAEAQAQARARAEEQEDRARRLAEEEAQARIRAEAKAREEAEIKARAEAEAAAAAEEEKKRAASKQAADHMLLERSIIIGKELDEIIQAQRKIAEDEADPMTLVKRELEEKLKFGPENLPGMPGMVPPTRRIIDELQGRRRTPPGEGPVPVPAVAEEAQVPPQQASSEPAKVLPTAMEFTEVEAGATESKVQLRASPASLDIRRPITVEWEMESAPSSSDWIGLYRVGSDNGSYVAYNWIRPATARGSMTFTPLEFGDYELRYFASTATFFSRQYSIKAVSNPVHVGPQVRLEPSYDAASNMMSVKIVQEAGNQYPSAWVGLYASRQETDNSRYRAFDWVANAVDHTLSFACPKAGEWEFRLFPQRSYVDVARAAVAVGGTDTVELALEDDGRQMVVRTRLTTVDPATDHVWVGIYRTDVGEDHRQYRKYKYVAQATGTIAFRACTTAATYEARVFANKRLDAPVAKSNTIVVLPAPQ